jgi:hypothetical protein
MVLRFLRKVKILYLQFDLLRLCFSLTARAFPLLN